VVTVGNGDFLKTKEPGIGSFFIIENYGVPQYSLIYTLSTDRIRKNKETASARQPFVPGISRRCGRPAHGKRKAPSVVRNQAAQAAGISQVCGRGQEKRSAIGPGSGRPAHGKRKAPSVVRNQAAQAAGMSQAGGRGQEKQPAIGLGSGRTESQEKEKEKKMAAVFLIASKNAAERALYSIFDSRSPFGSKGRIYFYKWNSARQYDKLNPSRELETKND
jgi:hypothetical protein